MVFTFEFLVLSLYNKIMEHEYTFNGQRPNEKVLDMVKNHVFVLFWPGLKAIFFIAIGAAAFIFWSNQFSGIILIIFLLVAFGIFSRSYYTYSQSVFLVTNQRVLNVEQKGFWKRKITETEIDKIQDVSSSVSGLFKIMLKFGNLVIRTAGASEGTEIRVKNISSPYEVQQEIAKLLQK